MAKSKQNKWDNEHLRNARRYARQVEAVYQSAAQEAAAIGVSVSQFNPDKPFTFADYPQTKARADALMKSVQGDVLAIIANGVESEWTLSNNKNNELARNVFGSNVGKLSPSQYRKYFSTNDNARKAFLARKEGGLSISDKVWRFTDQFQEEIEMGLDLGIRNGLPANRMARDLKQYLQNPDMLFRRVRDEHGQLHLSQRAKAYHPGQGVYRSSQKNAERLTRNETNASYREADYQRWQQFDFVVGIEIRLSNAHKKHDMCDLLAGKYPKGLLFEGWHVQCFCFAIPILKTIDELTDDNNVILSGGQPNTKSVNEVTEMPPQFKQWVQDNEGRIVKANEKGTLPNFLKKNREMWRDYTSIELINLQAIERTERCAGGFERQSNALAERMGVAVTPVNIKSRKRILEKAIADYGGDVFEVSDMIRNTFISSAENIPALISEIGKQFNVIERKAQAFATGYTGHLFKIWVRKGVKGEIQVNTPQMIYAKESSAKELLGTKLFNEIKNKSKMPHGLGHKYYEEYRILSREDQLSAKGRALAEKSKDYYQKAKAIKL
jgi:hypothetical protein